MVRSVVWMLAVAAAAAGCRGMREIPAAADDPTLAVLGVEPSSIACAAVAVARDLAVTASHCVPDAVVHYLTAADANRPPRAGRGFVVARDISSDLAAFSADGLVPAELGDEPPELDRVASMIAHVPRPWAVVPVRPHDIDDGFLRTGRLRVGASGSGLWNSDWRLVGVAIGNDNRSGYFASADRVRSLVRSVSRDVRGRVQVPEVRSECALPERSSDERRGPARGRGEKELERMLDAAAAKRNRIDGGLSKLDATLRKSPPRAR